MARPKQKPAADADPSRHLSTDHLDDDLKGRTVSSGIVTTIAQGAQMVINLGSIMALARLLPPQDFGLVAMVGSVMGVFKIFNDAGLSAATVQREGITHAQVSNLFWTNVALGGMVSVLLAISSPAIAWFFREPRLVGVTLGLCTTFLFTTLAVQHLALLRRQMRFKEIGLIQVCSTAAGVAVGIYMAWQGFGYWALVGMQVSTPVVALVMTWSASNWRPQLPTRGSGTRPLLGFGANLSASSFLWSLARGSDGFLIGRSYGSNSLGLYSRAAALLIRPVEQLITPFESVFVPTLSRLQTQPERYRRVALQAYEVIAVASFLFTGLLFALSRPLTLAVLGARWRDASTIFAGFTLVALYTPIASAVGWQLTSRGRGHDFLVLSTVASAATVAAFVAGLPFGPAGVAFAYSIACLAVILPITYHIVGREGPVRTSDLWLRFFIHLPVWIVVCAATWLTRTLVVTQAPWTELLICVPAGLLVGGAFIAVYPPSRKAALSLIEALRERIHFRT